MSSWSSDQANRLFRDLTGSSNHRLYTFQERAGQSIIDRNNTVIQAPTGSGKTWAAILPFLLAKKLGKPIADRLIYVLPLRTLAAQLKESTTNACLNAGLDIKVTIQTGSKPEDTFWQGDIVFMTIDQLLAGYLQVPYSGSRLANINAGALIGSLIVLDEIHLLDPAASLATTYEMIKRLAEYSRFVLMTATLSSNTVDKLAAMINAKALIPTLAEIGQMPSQVEKERRFFWNDTPLDAQAVLQYHNGRRCLVICNTVTKAQQIYLDLKNKKLDSPLLLLHGRFLPHDRKCVEKYLKPFFKDSGNGILIATQVVEAGIDISSDLLLTEICPANSLIQRAGRCARYPKEKGNVVVFQLEKNARGQYRYGPYSEKSDLVNCTIETLIERNGANIDPETEKQILQIVHETEEQETFQNLTNRLPKLKQLVRETMSGGLQANRELLIRDVDSVSIIVNSRPEDIDFSVPFEMISVPRIVLAELFSRKKECGWVAKVPRFISEEDDEENTVVWDVIQEYREIRGAWMLALSPRYAGYSPDIGLALNLHGGEMPIYELNRNKYKIKGYQAETFIEHALDVSREITQLAEAVPVAREYVSKRYNCDGVELVRLFQLTAVLHDIGKLSRDWQHAARKFQHYTDPDNSVLDPGEPLAHTTYSLYKHGEKVLQFRKRVPHAMEGAFAINGLVADICRNLLRVDADVFRSVIGTAIARHHSAFTKELSEFSLISASSVQVKKILNRVGLDYSIELFDSPTQLERIDFSSYLIKANREADERLLPLYWLFVRLLRLADQQSQIKKGGLCYENEKL